MLVGPDKKPFTVHKDIICSKSPFFQHATSRNWTAGKTGIIQLSETEPEIFHTYLHWVYTSKVDTKMMPDPPRCAPEKDSYEDLAKLWIFGDVMLDHELCNEVMSLVLHEYENRIYHDHPAPTTLRYVWGLTGGNHYSEPCS